MGYFSNLVVDIQYDIEEGLLPFVDIAKKYNVPVNYVDAVWDEMCEQSMDCDDSDDGYALASAGFGTDEDYGCYDCGEY